MYYCDLRTVSEIRLSFYLLRVAKKKKKEMLISKRNFMLF